MPYKKPKVLLGQFSSPRIVIGILMALVSVVIFNPYGVATGLMDSDPYYPIRSELTNTKDGKIILLSSFDDFYSIQSNEIRRRESSGEAFVERGYEEILSAASFGDEFFNGYLRSKGITHILVPLTTSERGEIRYKWGELGSIRIKLSEPYFSAIVGTAGDFPVVLYKVLGQGIDHVPQLANPSYSIKWGPDIRGEFYKVIRSQVEKGLYSYEYSKSYESGLDVNWVFSYPRSAEGLSDIPEIAEFQYQSKSPETEHVNAEITLVAAYGPLAPPQIVRVIHNGESVAYSLTATQPAVVKLQLANGDWVRFSNVLPCRQPQTFQQGEEDWRKYCFGVSDIQIRPGS
jgi:hypothetical protein